MVVMGETSRRKTKHCSTPSIWGFMAERSDRRLSSGTDTYGFQCLFTTSYLYTITTRQKQMENHVINESFTRTINLWLHLLYVRAFTAFTRECTHRNSSRHFQESRTAKCPPYRTPGANWCQEPYTVLLSSAAMLPFANTLIWTPRTCWTEKLRHQEVSDRQERGQWCSNSAASPQGALVESTLTVGGRSAQASQLRPEKTTTTVFAAVKLANIDVDMSWMHLLHMFKTMNFDF